MSDDQFSKLSKQIADIGSQLDKKIDGLRDEMNERFEAVDQRFEAMDQRFEQIDARFEAVDERFEAIDKRFDVQELRFKAMLDERFKEFEEGSFDRLAGHLSTEIDGVKEQLSSIAREVTRNSDLIDGLYKLRADDEKKQAEQEGEQRRQRKWIRQLADHSGAKLAPEM